MFRHLVHFYDEGYPGEEACDFIAAGLRAGDTCVVMLTGTNRRAVDRGLEARRLFNTPSGQHAGQYHVLDTDIALAGLMAEGRLDLDLAAAALNAMLDPASYGGKGKVRLVGDPAPTLFAAGNEDDAMALEALVGKLCALHSASVFCAYSKQDLHRHGKPHTLAMLCAAHDEASSPERPDPASRNAAGPDIGRQTQAPGPA